MAKTFTREQMATLAAFADNMRYAVLAQWCRAETRERLDTLHGIFCTVMGVDEPIQYGCGTCTLNLLTDVGRLYFSQLAESLNVGDDMPTIDAAEVDRPDGTKAYTRDGVTFVVKGGVITAIEGREETEVKTDAAEVKTPAKKKGKK